jgi:hypothetical protein
MDTDSLIRSHSVALAEVQQKHNAELIRIKRLVQLELSKLRLVATANGSVSADIVFRIESRINSKL